MGVYISDSNGKLQKFAGLGKKDILPTENSKNAVESGGVYSFVNNAISSLENLALSWGHDNLLINGNFVVNQRGSASYSTNTGYTVDRWILRGSCTVVPQANRGVKITSTNTEICGIFQSIENYGFLLGKTVTISCKISNVSAASSTKFYFGLCNANQSYSVGTLLSPENLVNPANGIYSVTTTLPSSLANNLLNVFVVFAHNRNQSGDTLTVEWIKMEMGNVATSFSPRPYAEELSLCQRYYIKIKGDTGYGLVGTGFVYSSSRAFISVPLPTTMRTSPTYGGGGTRRLLVSAGYKDYSSFSVDSISPHTISCRIDGSGFTAGQGCGFYFYNDTSAYIDFDAEIY